MTKRLIPILILILAAAGFGQETAAPNLGGYLYFDFSQSQEDGLFSNGRAGGLGAGVFLAGALSGQFSYMLEARLMPENEVKIEQAWLGFSPSKSLRFTLGHFLVPFGRFNQANRPHERFLVQVPLVCERAYPASWRELGLQAWGKSGFLNIAAFIGNGLAESESASGGQQFGDNNADKAWGGRLGVQPDQSLELGFSYYKGKYDALGTRNLTMLGADAAWTTRDYQVLAEYIKADRANPDPWGQGITEGYFVQMAIKYSDFSPVVSYQKVKDNDPFHGPGWASPDQAGAGLALDQTRWALGLIYLPVPNVRLKAEYDFNRETGVALKDDLWSVQAAITF